MKRPLSFYIFLALTLALCIVIFLFSSDNGDKSGEKSSAVTEFVLKIVMPSFSKMSPDEQSFYVNKYSFLVRKCAHFSEYALLGFLSFGTCITGGSGKKRGASGAAIFSFLYATGDEIHQHFVGGRYPSPVDVAIDTLGALSGIVFFILVLVAIRVAKEKREG